MAQDVYGTIKLVICIVIALKKHELHLAIRGIRTLFWKESDNEYLLQPRRLVPYSEACDFEVPLQLGPVTQSRGYSGQSDYWRLDLSSRILTRIHKRLRQNHFNPITTVLKDGCPVDPSRRRKSYLNA